MGKVAIFCAVLACGKNIVVMSESDPNSADAERNSAGLTMVAATDGNRVAGGKLKFMQETFSQTQKGILDILLVIDNSSSMQDEQTKLAENLPDLLDHVSDSNWQIAVIGTTLQSCLSAAITKDTPDFEEEYKQLVDLDLLPNGEFHFYKAIQGLKGECGTTSNAWLRSRSTVVVLIVTDQHNECHEYNDGDPSGQQLPADAPCTSSDLKKQLAALRAEDNTGVYGLLPSTSNWESYKDKDPSVTSIFSHYGSITAASYDATLQAISKKVSNILEDVFELEHIPAGGVSVIIDGEPLATTSYTIDAEQQLLKFDKGYVPPEKAEIEASYSYLEANR